MKLQEHCPLCNRKSLVQQGQLIKCENDLILTWMDGNIPLFLSCTYVTELNAQEEISVPEVCL